MSSISPILPIQTFSVAQNMTASSDITEVSLQSVAEAFVAASEQSQAKTSALAELAQSGLSPQALLQLQMGINDWRQQTLVVSLLASETAKSFKTLTQQS